MSNSGDLSQMAKDGTTIPGDAGKQDIVPSVASEHQKKDTSGGLGQASLHGAADNAAAALGEGSVGEAVTGTGDTLPESIANKHSGHGGKER